MTKVNAYQIVEQIEWVNFVLGEPTSYSAVVVSKNGKKRAVESIDDEPWAVGDWVVLWPSRHKTVYKPDYFEKHFSHIDGIRYETNLS